MAGLRVGSSYVLFFNGAKLFGQLCLIAAVAAGVFFLVLCYVLLGPAGFGVGVVLFGAD